MMAASLLFVLVNVTSERLIGSWLEKIFAKRRARELLVGLFCAVDGFDELPESGNATLGRSWIAPENSSSGGVFFMVARFVGGERCCRRE